MRPLRSVLLALMPMRVMNIREMRVFVLQGRVLVPVRVRHARWVIGVVVVLVVLVVGVGVFVFQRFVRVIVLVALGQVQVDA